MIEFAFIFFQIFSFDQWLNLDLSLPSIAEKQRLYFFFFDLFFKTDVRVGIVIEVWPTKVAMHEE